MSFLPFFKKKVKIEYFLALLLREEKVSAVVFEETLGKVKIIGKHQEYFQASIEDAKVDEWLDVLDKAISSAESSLPQDIETHKTIFGVKENWIDGSKIKKEYLLKLKKVSETLSLSPIGFMVIQEAIAHLIQKEEGVPVSAILIEVDKKNIAVSLLKAGRIIDTKRSEIEKTIPYTTDQALHYFAGHDVLPSRIVLFDGEEDLESLSQEFISHPWSKSLPFLHVPQVSILGSGFDARAVLFGAATQMGFEMTDKDERAEIIKPQIPVRQKTLQKETEEEQKGNETPDIDKDIVTEESIPKDNFGFVLDKDIVLEQNIEQEEKAIEKDESSLKKATIEEKVTDKEYAIEIEKTTPPSSKNIIKNATKLAFILTFFRQILFFGIFKLFNFKKIFSFIPRGGEKVTMAFIVLLIFIILIPAIYFFGLKSTVTIELKPKIVEKSQEVSFVVEESSDFSKKIIQGEYVEVSKEGSLSTPSTGKKEVGDKAKGNVTIYSRLPSEKILAAGTVVTSSNDLDFTLDNDVKLASSSADASSDPTTAKIGVTAKKIGKEFNLPSNTKFIFGNLPASSIVAKNEIAFSGGSKKEIKVVSKEDMDKIAAKLPKELEDDAKNELIKNVSSDKEIIPLFVNTDIKKEFDKKAGDEADIFTIKGTVTYQAISYKKGELSEFSKSLVSNDTKDLYISSNGVKYELTNLKQKSEKEVIGTFKVKAFLYPTLEKEKIAKELAGKSLNDAESIVSRINHVDSVDIILHPAFPFLPKAMPRRPENISLKIINNE